MKKPCLFLLMACLLLFRLSTYAQQLPVPFRVGDKFGVADESGHIVIKPQFDWITVSNYKQIVFTGYNENGGKVSSSLIFKNRILLRDKAYNNYFLRNDLFTAVNFKITDPVNPNFNDRFVQREDLITVDGRKLIDGNFIDITPLDGIEEENLRYTLVTTTDSAYRHTLFLYDKVQKMITKTFFSNSNYLDFTNNTTINYKNKSYTFVFLDNKGHGHQLVIKNDGKAFQIVVDKAILVPPPPPRQHYFEQAYDFPQPVFDNKLTPPKDSNSTVIKSYERRGGYYYQPRKKEHLRNSIQVANGNRLVFKNGKMGLMDNGVLVIPIQYDDILKGDFEGPSGGYVLRLGDKYQVCYYSDNKPIILKAVFDKIPLLIANYFADCTPLVKLYDDNGDFFCYANSAGKLYYSTK